MTSPGLGTLVKLAAAAVGLLAAGVSAAALVAVAPQVAGVVVGGQDLSVLAPAIVPAGVLAVVLVVAGDRLARVRVGGTVARPVVVPPSSGAATTGAALVWVAAGIVSTAALTSPTLVGRAGLVAVPAAVAWWRSRAILSRTPGHDSVTDAALELATGDGPADPDRERGPAARAGPTARQRTTVIAALSGVVTTAVLLAALPVPPLLAPLVALRAATSPHRPRARRRLTAERALARLGQVSLGWSDDEPISPYVDYSEDGEIAAVVYPVSDRLATAQEERAEQNLSAGLVDTLGDEWEFVWDHSDRQIVCRRRAPLPDSDVWDGSAPVTWDRIPVGAGRGGVDVEWDLTIAPHILIAGRTGGGKSVAIKSLVARWIVAGGSVVGCDQKRVEFRWMRDRPVVLAVATSLEDIAGLLGWADQEQMRRYETMESEGVTFWQDLPDEHRPAPLLIVCDEAFALMAVEKVAKDDEAGNQRNLLRGQCSGAIGSVARLGRAAGVHLMLATQRPDATVLSGELKNNLGARLACGQLDGIASRMVLDSDAATLTPARPKGRGIFIGDGSPVPHEVQITYSDDDMLDRHLSDGGGPDDDGGGGGTPASAPRGAPAGPAPGHRGPARVVVRNDAGAYITRASIARARRRGEPSPARGRRVGPAARRRAQPPVEPAPAEPVKPVEPGDPPEEPPARPPRPLRRPGAPVS